MGKINLNGTTKGILIGYSHHQKLSRKQNLANNKGRYNHLQKFNSGSKPLLPTLFFDSSVQWLYYNARSALVNQPCKFVSQR